jgi:hypothetical protein
MGFRLSMSAILREVPRRLEILGVMRAVSKETA